MPWALRGPSGRRAGCLHGALPKSSKAPFVPLTSLQRDVLALIAGRRGPESFVAGGIALNRGAARYSEDIDIFHDRVEAVTESAVADVKAIKAAGLEAELAVRAPGFATATVRRGDETMRLDWAFDSDYRFYPARPDPEFGFTLHPIDLATNKVLAAAGRREPRDAVDVVMIDRLRFPLSIVVAAAVAKDPGYSPESLINSIRRLARYRQEELVNLESDEPIDAGELSRAIKAALERAERFIEKLPSAYAGLLFLEGGKIVEPDFDRLDSYELRACTRAGLWPTDPVAISALLKRP